MIFPFRRRRSDPVAGLQRVRDMRRFARRMVELYAQQDQRLAELEASEVAFLRAQGLEPPDDDGSDEIRDPELRASLARIEAKMSAAARA